MGLRDGFEEMVSEVGQIGWWDAKIGVGLAVVGRSGTCIAQSGLASSELGLSKMKEMRMDKERRKVEEEKRKERKKRKIVLTVAWRGRGRHDLTDEPCLGCLLLVSL